MIAESQSELSRLNSELAELKKQEKPVSALSARIEAGDRAAKVAGSYEAFQVAQSELNEATLALEELNLDSRVPKEAAEVKALLAKVNSILGSLASPLAAELGLPTLLRAAESADSLLVEAKGELGRIEDEIRELNDERKALKPLADNLEGNRLALEAAQSAMQRFKTYQDTKIEIDNLQSEKRTLSLAADASKLAYAEIFTQYKDSQAGLLAVDLNSGEECPVCGATEHPKKAKATGQVSEKQLENARIAAEKLTADLATLEQKLLDAGERFDPLAHEFSAAKASVVEKSLAKAEADHDSSRKATTRIAEIADLVDGESSELVLAKSSATENRDSDSAAVTSAKTEVKTAEKLIAKHLGDFESIQAHSDWLNVQLEQLRDLEELVTSKSEAASTLKSAETGFNKQLASNKFESLEKFLSAFIESDELEVIRTEVLAHKDELNRVSTLLSQNKFKSLPSKTLNPLETAEAFSRAQTKRDETKTSWESSKAKVAQIKTAKKSIQSLVSELGSSRTTYETYRGLSEAMNGKGKNTKQMSLEVYFAAAELETILEAANLHLSTMDAGDQFTLMHSDRSLRGAGQSGLGIEVMDDHTSRTRLPGSLSGGEKFQVSLAIALGLAQVVSERAGSIQVDTLFIDEGFGTLSGHVLESAMRTLDGLKQGGRMIGLISHVEKMKEEISAKVIVEKTPRGPSKVTTQI
jgi:exonuclease SbcC